MFNPSLPPYTPSGAAPVIAESSSLSSGSSSSQHSSRQIANAQVWKFFTAAIFLVSVPVFIQAPLVRIAPGLSLVMTLLFVGLGFWLLERPKLQTWGDLMLGFSWSWLAGSLYWGWLRWEPLWHIPVEAIGLPFVLLSLWRGTGKVGNLFYLGSLLGTVITDLYFYIVDLIPYWRQLMQVEPELALPIFQGAIATVKTPWGVAWIGVLAPMLLLTGILSLRSQTPHGWAFSGAVLGTILVDSLFWFAAAVA
ncbi:MAG: DUF3120 domain-containing protein [Leptolyngbyaceae cyanobacterium bins.59]|nr:DUF3120 domain-containing protein [Leptolyngbyaceae cyanobacterium bins.59]